MFESERFIEECQATLREDVPGLAMRELMLATVERQSEIITALGEPTAGAIETLHHADDLTVLRIVWTPGMRLYPHNHNMWAVIGIYGGQENNAFFRRSDTGGLDLMGGSELELHEAVVLGADIIHAVRNPRDREFTQALHVYGGDFFNTPRSEWDPETDEERPYDIERARQVFKEANERYQAALAADRQGS